MKKNIGMGDRLLRLVIAILLLVYAYWTMSWIAFALALFVLFEFLMSWCIIYQILGKNSCPVKRKKR
jgi:hypothetical protein